MKYALLHDEYVTATPHQKGAVCPLCLSEVVARCGEINVHHWAHKKGAHCDVWCEPDSEWRHKWLDSFSGCRIEQKLEIGKEKHFIDVQTEFGTNILLRRGRIKEAELAKMEDFFPSLVWIVDLGSAKRAVNQFGKAHVEGFISHSFDEVYKTIMGDEGLPSAWTKCRYPVFFDFSSAKDLPGYISDFLWCLMPYEAHSCVYDRVLIRYTKEEMIESLKKRRLSLASDVQKKVASLNKKVKEKSEQRFQKWASDFRKQFPSL